MGEAPMRPSSPTSSEHSFYLAMTTSGSSDASPYNGDATPTMAGQSPFPLIRDSVSSDHHTVFFEQEEEGRRDRQRSGRDTVAVGIEEANPQERWLPLTQSTNGNTLYAVFHIVSSGIGIQALLLPLAFSALGWIWGIICLSTAFAWQLYTVWLLVQLHESPSGARCSRFIRLSINAFGEKLGKLLAIFPVMYLSGGTCVTLIITGSGTMQRFYQTVCQGEGDPSCDARRLSGVEWYLVFACMAFLLAQLLPHLNSTAKASLIGAVSGLAYCTMIWAVSVHEGRATAQSEHYHPMKEEKSREEKVMDSLNALGIIALSFKGHNVILEIQGTLPSDSNRPSRVLMWRAAVISYILIAMCLYPLAIVGHWAYRDMISISGIPTVPAMLSLFQETYGQKISKLVMSLTLLLIVINSLTSFQVYAMVVFDNLEFRYTAPKNRPCPWWLRRLLRVLFGGLAFFVAVALPFLGSLSPLIGGITLPLTFVYPCFMYNAIRKPKANGKAWFVNLGLGSLGILLSAVLVAAAISNLTDKGMQANFFKP